MKKLLLLLIVIPIICQATIYKKTNPDGSFTYSDEYVEGSTKVVIDDQDAGRVTVTIEEKSSPLTKLRKQFLGQDTDDSEQQTTHSKDTQQASYKRLVISNPSEEQSFWNQPAIGVMVQSEPALSEGHKIQLFLDGGRVFEPKAGNKFSLNNLQRGEHSVKAAIINENGQPIIESASVKFFVHRTSVKETKLKLSSLKHFFST